MLAARPYRRPRTALVLVLSRPVTFSTESRDLRELGAINAQCSCSRCVRCQCDTEMPQTLMLKRESVGIPSK